MKVTSTLTGFSDPFLHQLLRWCGEQVGLSATKALLHAHFHNAAEKAWDVKATSKGELIVSIGPEKKFPLPPGRHLARADRLEALVGATCHGLSLFRQWADGAELAQEGPAAWAAEMAMGAFRLERESLILAWSEDVAAAAAERRSTAALIERRSAKAAADLARWQRRLKFAQTKVKKLKARVRYYAKKKNKS